MRKGYIDGTGVFMRHVFLKKEFFPDELPVVIDSYTCPPGKYGNVENLREFWKITMTGKSRMKLFFYGKAYLIPPESVFLSRPQDLTNIEADQPMEITNLLILCPFMEKTSAGLPDNAFFRILKDPLANADAPRLFTVRANAGIRSKFRSLRSELLHTDQCTPAVLQSLLRLLLTDFYRQWLLEKQQNAAAARISAVDHYLAEHFREKILLAELADRTGVSVGYLTRKYKKETGHTIGETIQILRVDCAARLLRETSYTHRQIREHCGFPDSGSFYRAFRQQKGTTPAEWAASVHDLP